MMTPELSSQATAPSWFRDPDSMSVVLDSVPDGLIVEENDRVIYSNSAYASQLGYTCPELVGQPISDIVAPCDRERLLLYGRHRIEGRSTPTRYSFSALQKDGSPAVVSAAVSVARLRSASIILTSIRMATVELPTVWSDERKLLEGLTRREREVLVHLLDGLSPKRIALQMNVSVKTIATFRARALSKLSIQSTRDLFCFGLRAGLVS
jgi:PAS domain S-box-containing protein